MNLCFDVHNEDEKTKGDNAPTGTHSSMTDDIARQTLNPIDDEQL